MQSRAGESFAQAMKRLRKEHAWSLQDLADRAGLTKATVQNVERGREPGIGNAAAIAASFGMSIDEMIKSGKPTRSKAPAA